MMMRMIITIITNSSEEEEEAATLKVCFDSYICLLIKRVARGKVSEGTKWKVSEVIENELENQTVSA